jgi:site-specific recombinase XerD
MSNSGRLPKVEQWNGREHERSPRHGRRREPVSLLAALNQFTVYMREERRASPATLDAYERDLLRFTTGLDGGAELAIAAVSAEDVRDHMHALLNRRLSPATVRRALYAISSFFGWAQKWELVTVSPTARLTIPRRERTREVRALSKRERALVLAAADRLMRESHRPLDAQAPLLVRLLMKVGLRRAEAIALLWREVHLRRKEIVVRFGKGGKTRRVPVEDKELLSLLHETREARGIGDRMGDDSPFAPVLVGRSGRQLPEQSLYKIFHRVLSVAELQGKGITPHSLRHTFGTVLCDRGVPVPYVKELLGHADIGSTMVYVHSTPAALRAAVRKLRE